MLQLQSLELVLLDATVIMALKTIKSCSVFKRFLRILLSVRKKSSLGTTVGKEPFVYRTVISFDLDSRKSKMQVWNCRPNPRPIAQKSCSSVPKRSFQKSQKLFKFPLFPANLILFCTFTLHLRINKCNRQNQDAGYKTIITII